ncbi:SDR family NAD(P)-dependent oxidoreductase [Thermodesulfobacteriota bacterium]
MKLEGKVALVTGARQGLGKSIALGLAEAGADLVVVDRVLDDGKLAKVAEEIQGLGRRSVYSGGDITVESDVDAMVKKAIDEFGKIDVLVNNAGVTTPDSFLKLSIKRWNLVMSVNLDGTFVCTKAVLPKMIEQGSGCVINVSSILAEQIKFSIPYGVTKAGVERLTKGLAREMRKNENIAITCIRPYFVKTEVVTEFLPDVDTSDWETPEMWCKYTAMVAGADAKDITGKILDKKALVEMFGEV